MRTRFFNVFFDLRYVFLVGTEVLLSLTVINSSTLCFYNLRLA